MLFNQFIYVLLAVLIHSNNVLTADPVVPPAGQAVAPADPPVNPTIDQIGAVNVETTATTPLIPDVANAAETTPLTPAIPTTPTTPPAAVAPTTQTTETPIVPQPVAVETTSTSSTITTPTVPSDDDDDNDTLLDTTNTALTTGTTVTPVTGDTVTTDDLDTETGIKTGTETKETKGTSSTASTEKPEETINPDLVSDKIVGTWSSKANTVFTGPGFYDPVDELLIEPALPGISYSFTEDGYWEEAIYQVSPNPRNHSCPAAVLIFQHGTYTMGSNGSLVLTPFEVDGRQLLSEPCSDGGVSIYSRYKQLEKFKGYQVYVDPYHGRWRLDLIKSNGEIMQPLYLAYQPPQMLPTITMNPTAEATGNSKGKREFNEIEGEYDLSLAARVKRSLENQYRTNAILKDSKNYAVWWWASVTMIAVGAGLFVFS